MGTLRTIALCFGLASAQLVSLGLDGSVNSPTLTQSCPPVLTVTVLPPDYTGIFTNVAGLPTLSLPSLDPSPSLPTVLPSLSLDLPTALPSLTLPFSIPTAIPTNLLPSITLALPTISLPASALLPTSLLAGPTPTPVAYTCPEYDGQTIFENGLLYVLSCGGQATGSAYTAYTADNTNTFNDCFTACDEVGTLSGALFCTGFSFVPDASGSGTCFLQNSVAQSIVSGGSGRVAAVRLLNYIVGGNSLAPVLSALPTVPLSIPTGLPTIALPSLPLSSILTGLSSDLAGLSTGFPLPTGLPLSSILDGVSSDLASVTTGLPLSSILNVVSSDLAGVPGSPLSSVLNGLSSTLAGLTTISLPTLSLPAVSTPTASVALPTLSLPVVSIPTIPVVVPTSLSSIPTRTGLDALTTVLNGLTTVLAVPTLSIPNISPPAISNSLTGVSSLPAISFSGATLSLLSSNILSGISTAPAVPTTNLLPGFPGLSTPLPAAASSRSSAASAASLSSASADGTRTTTPIVSITPTATSNPIFRCPEDNGLAYLSSADQVFQITCGRLLNGNDISYARQPNLQSCVDSCGAVGGCTDVTYSLGICTYKTAVGNGVASLIADSAAPLDLSCPAGDGNTYIDSLGGNYQILCNTTFPAATVLSPPPIKRDLARRAVVPAVAPAVTCSRRCTSLAGCIGAYASSNGICTFLSAFGNAGTGSSIVDSIVMVGRRFVAVVSGSTVTSTSRATAIPAYTTRTNSAIYDAPITTTTTPMLSLPSVSIGVSLTLGAGVGVSVTGIPPLATPSGFATTASTTISQVTRVLPVTTVLTTSTLSICNQGSNGFITCPAPVFAATNTLLSTGIPI